VSPSSSFLIMYDLSYDAYTYLSTTKSSYYIKIISDKDGLPLMRDTILRFH
jgi:hypothetical protein